jgi:hypothetical protein
MGVGARGWAITNATPASFYFGAGGSYNPPDDAYEVSGPWLNDFEVDAGVNSVLRVHCNLYTCGRWDSGYKLFDLDSVGGGEDELTYSPASSTATWQLRGGTYSFSPSAFTAGTINVGTLNATTITGGVSGAAVTSGTISAARLPLFGPSGTTHAAGVVPDPGATAGATRYLREDGTWSVPAGGSGGAGSGSMSSQNANAVAITGGTIDGAVIGGSTPQNGSFTNLTLSNGGLLYIDNPAISAGRNSVFGQYGSGLIFGSGDAAPWSELDFYVQSKLLAMSQTGAAFSVPVSSPSYVGPASAPSGACSTTGAWIFSQDGHASFCSGGTWVTKI